MTDLDLERLGDVWRQRPDPAELEELRRTAAAVRRRARWAQVIDVVAAITVAGVVLLLVLSSPRIDTIIVGAGAVLILLVSQVRQRRVRRIELKSLTGTTEEMLDQAIARLKTTLRQNRFSLLALVPAVVLGLALGTIVKKREGQELFAELIAGPWPRNFLVILFAIILLAAMAAYLVRRLRRDGRELGRLTTLRDAYRGERESSAVE